MKNINFCASLLVLACILTPGRAWAAQGSEKGYLDNWAYNWGRGTKNIISSPMEIPLTIQKYHAQPGRPVIRHFAGFIDGTFRMCSRSGSGLWDMVWAGPVPGAQDGAPVAPEVLF